MRIATILHEGRTVVAVRQDQHLVDLSIAVPDLPGTMRDLLRGWDRALPMIRSGVAAAPASSRIDPAAVEWRPVIGDPGKVL